MHRKGAGVGYLIAVKEQKLYHPGDSDFTPEMELLRNIDVAFLPIGGRGFTMDVDEAIKAAVSINPKVVKTCHQSGGIARVCCIQMENISAGRGHGLSNSWYCLPVSTGQTQNELTPQVLDFRSAQVHVSDGQFGSHLLGGFVPLIHGSSKEDHSIVCYV